MATTPYKPVSFTSESISQTKLQQMANNEQWLFENMAKMRYATQALTRDAGVRVISGKTPFGTTTGGASAIDTHIYFGSFFTAGCKPVVTGMVETTGPHLRKLITIRGFGGEVDHRGFVAHLSTQEFPGVPVNIEASGWIHWQAIGY